MKIRSKCEFDVEGDQPDSAPGVHGPPHVHHHQQPQRQPGRELINKQ